MGRETDRLSDYLVMLVQIVFAVVIAQSLETFRAVLIDPFDADHVTALVALIAVYVTAVLSWIDWHRTMVIRPYNLHRYNDSRRVEEFRLYLDVAIVVTYAYLLFSVEPFVNEPGANIGWHLFGYVLVYALYLASGWTRRRSYGVAASNFPPIVAFLAFTTALVAVYFVLEPHLRNTVLNVLAVLVFLGSSIAYRLLRRAYIERLNRRRRKGLVLGFDVDGVLGDQITGVLPRIKEKYGIDLHYQDVTEWRLPVDSSDIAVEIEEAVREPSYVLRMPVHAGAKETLDELFKTHRVRVLTARAAAARDLTEQWLRNRRLPFDDLINTSEATKSLHGADVLVDDYLGNVEEFLTNSSPKAVAVLVDQPWNRDRGKRDELEVTGRFHVVESVDQVKALVAALEAATTATSGSAATLGAI